LSEVYLTYTTFRSLQQYRITLHMRRKAVGEWSSPLTFN
jgi:hypothetical protein